MSFVLLMLLQMSATPIEEFMQPIGDTGKPHVIAHRGFSLIDVFSPCVTYNTINTYPWFKNLVYTLEDEEGYDSMDFKAAIDKSLEFGDSSNDVERIPIGLFYREEKAIYDDSEPLLQESALVDQPLGLSRERFDELLAESM